MLVRGLRQLENAAGDPVRFLKEVLLIGIVEYQMDGLAREAAETMVRAYGVQDGWVVAAAAGDEAGARRALAAILTDAPQS